jgi:hypothetical protein
MGEMSVKKPHHQRILKWSVFILLGLVSLGALLDAISNAVSLITPQATYVGSAVLIVGWLLTEALASLFGIPWVSGGQPTRIRRLGPQVRFGLFGMLILLWVPRLGDLPRSDKTIPSVGINLVNPSSADIMILRRGEFVLWLPTALYDGAPRVGGRFTLTANDDAGYSDAPISLMSGGSKRLTVKILAEEQFVRYLERGDTDLTLMLQTSNGSSWSPTIPFTRDTLLNRYLEWEVEDKSRK